MPAGKLAAQAGHAFLGAFLHAIQEAADRAAAYRADPPGTKVVLRSSGLQDLERACLRASRLGLPHVLITDRGHVLPPDFDGTPVVTALGVGPITRSEARGVTNHFKLAP